MNKTYSRLLAAFLLVASVSFVQEAKLAPAARKQIETTVAKFMTANNVPGISVAVVEARASANTGPGDCPAFW